MAHRRLRTHHAPVTTTPSPEAVNRRVVLRRVGAALLAVPLLPLIACGDDGTGESGADAGSGGSAGTGGNTGTGGSGGATAAWATGGTAAMTGKASYPNPFDGVALTSCVLTCEMTVGPCYSSQSEVIQDISYGQDGLPARVYLRVVDESCNPVAGALVDVWHVGPVGKYSGNDTANEQVSFCTGDDADYTSHLYFRGKQTTDANGVVFFDTCYPGWYSGRTVHIHMTITAGGASTTTQLLFDDTLNDDILTTQALYSSRGARNTTNQNDSVVAASAVADYLFETQPMTDGALLAWKTLVLRSSSASGCTVPGGSGAGGPGAPPA